MNTNTDILSFMDILQLDEEIVDKKLRSLMVRTKFSNKNLTEAVSLLNYKYLVNIQEDTECENDYEYDFVFKLIKKADEDIIDNVCRIIKIVLLLNKSSAICKCEHLLQQLLVDFFTDENELLNKPNMIKLKLCCSILDAVSEIGEKVSLMFIETPLEKILDLTDDKLKIYFITRIVPHLSELATEYNILDRIWYHIKTWDSNKKAEALKILSCLSDYYLPVGEGIENIKFESTITKEYDFWKTILFGLQTNDVSLRKISIYLAKKAIEIVIIQKKSLQIVSNNDTIFTWDNRNVNVLKSKWEYYFILIESLEEQQSNIVLPSIQLFKVLKDFGHKWLICAFNIGLRHDNSQVKLKCIEKRLKIKIIDFNEAQTLLEALNDVNIYEFENDTMKNKILGVCKNQQSFLHIFKAIPNIKWSPVPLYHLSEVLANLEEDYSVLIKESDVLQTIKDILKISCNNVTIRKAVHINLSHFIGNCFKNINWEIYIDIYSLFKLSNEISETNPFVCLLKHINISDDEKQKFYKYITKSYTNIEIGLLYLKYHEDDVNMFLEIVNEMIFNIQTIISKQYSDKFNVFKDVLYLLQLHTKTKVDNNVINKLVNREIKTILQYILGLFCFDRQLSIEDVSLLFRTIDITSMTDKEMLLELYKIAVMFTKDEKVELDKKILAIFTISSLHDAPLLRNYHKHELIDIKTLIDSKIDFYDTDRSVGRLKNAYFEKSCEIIYKSLDDNVIDVKAIEDFIEIVIECGGYGCLKWILRIVKKILFSLLTDSKKFDANNFLKRMWNEIEELKSNNQYNICIKEFIVLLTQDILLQKSEHNNLVISYCNKIIDYGPVKNTPLFYLIEELSSKDFEICGHMLYVLCDILVYCPVPRRDQRIADCVAQEILKGPKYGINPNEIAIHFNYEIQYNSIEILSKIKNNDVLEGIMIYLIKRVDDIFKSKQRYHGNSQTHRTLLMVLQHLIVILLLNWRRRNFKSVNDWCMEFLGKIPHQPSVKICLEWYIALYHYMEKIELNEDTVNRFKSKNVPLISQFYIFYWLVNHKLRSQNLSITEYEFILDTFLSYTMGQLFNIRLHSQYMASKLHNVNNNKNSNKYDYIISIIQTTFEESEKDKTFMKLKEDYFANDFDIIKDLNPAFIYYYLPKYCALYDENIDVDYIKNKLNIINANIASIDFDEFKKEWLSSRWEFNAYSVELRSNEDSKLDQNLEEIGTIQKKYIPWKNMSDVNVYEVGKKKQTASELIVVASLIDKLPNLGGMARTSEVFGVKTYVVDSLRHLQDRQFQGLSVSAERWIDVEEVRPGRALKEYLAKKKSEGYSVVAAEQTSTSCKLQSFKFPKKTLLLLGHEKEGIPCDLLPLMDHCVEIPQQGFVRSLNVHVTAAIFVWEYSRQNIL
ncbi:hypothetical protein K1T71_008997 [Dendrolimus kikuchii]|uniref:Uncharacterized protein n=1 Tax=Dendrolimus kikuchii TaxID=765133 RepID=A0ACC1CW00_9NEOP|nr:hypothetical protein K1T71_008997 [Dendrolimus kikuchii]